MRRVNAIISGLGNLGWRFLEILDQKRAILHNQFGLDVRIVGAVDSRGGAVSPDGLDLMRVVTLKKQRQSVGMLGEMGLTPQRILRTIAADIYFDATPVNLKTGEPGLSCIRTALRRGMHVVTPNKGPIVLAYRELTELAQERGVELKFDGTVCGGLPAVNLGRRDLAGTTIYRLDALPNLTTSFILEKMERGMSYNDAIRAAQEQGCAETDPALDVEGYDAAIKLTVLAKSVLGIDAVLADVQREGITGITLDDIKEARAASKVIKLVASAVRQKDGLYKLSTLPTWLPREHPLAQLRGQQMGIVYETDLFGTISAAITEVEPIPSAATMWRDMLAIYGE